MAARQQLLHTYRQLQAMVERAGVNVNYPTQAEIANAVDADFYPVECSAGQPEVTEKVL